MRFPAYRYLIPLFDALCRLRGLANAYGFRNSSGSFATLAAIRLGCERVAGAIKKVYWCRLFARAHSR